MEIYIDVYIYINKIFNSTWGRNTHSGLYSRCLIDWNCSLCQGIPEGRFQAIGSTWEASPKVMDV